jgi:YbgC/YbaW family acyl-CoA thioester hydrolase
MLKEITTQTKIRFVDCDPIGHLNNAKYIDYMLNAREDHVEAQFGFSYEQYTQKTGCTWIAIQNEIAYLKELRYNTQVNITSRLIDINERISKIEVTITNLDNTITHAVLWASAIYFNMKTRKSELLPSEDYLFYQSFINSPPEQNFSDRVAFYRQQNKIKNQQ